jgi:hypothetical protein
MDTDAEADWHRINQIRKCFFVEAEKCGDEEVRARTVVSVICDLKLQGWQFQASSDAILAAQPGDTATSVQAQKERIRTGLLIERDAQLRSGATREFIQKMGCRHVHSGEWVSIYSLMRDGCELAESLQQARAITQLDRIDALRSIIDPYIQLVDDSRCEHTGLLLKEVWRYFRHTWVTTYQSVPGRNVWFLVRDRAAKFHPVIGIAALGSAIVQLTVRDQWIGWNRDAFLKWAKANQTDKLATWVWSSLNDLIGGIYVEDFLQDRLITNENLAAPDDEVISNLRSFARQAKATHELYPKTAEHKANSTSAEDWEKKVKAYLYQYKRAETLAHLLKAKQQVLMTGMDHPSTDGLQRLLSSSLGRNAIAEIARQVKGSHVGNDMMDIIICGAVQPYNAILGGKLVALLMTSPEVAEVYQNRYRDAPSVIASSMAGRPVYRQPQLVFLGTTSLYGVGSSQYNRLRLPASEVGTIGDEDIRYHELGHTEGFGSYHFSVATIQEMEKLAARHTKGRRVNSIFGEGVNPRLRKIRDALQLAGFRAESLLNHGDRRIIYGVPLVTNFREILLGLESVPKRIFPDEPPLASTKRIADFWIRRWLSPRIENDGVLAQVAQHNLLYPIRHGARVILPPLPDDTPMFNE